MPPRPFDSGQPRGPEKIGEVLARLFTARGWGRATERQQLESAWARAAGADIAPYTRVLGLKRGVLEVEVRGGGALLHELAGFHKRRLIATLAPLLCGRPLKDIRFRAGGG
ncbi:MAG: DUF721 domain-containing protein [Gemmataceae bacterium]|nr:DUF721 domain-containing protein [Gemmataceae bacterium]